MPIIALILFTAFSALADDAVKIADSKTGKQYEISASANSHGVLLANWIDTRSGEEECALSVSDDGGRTWGANRLAGRNSADPVATVDSAGNLYVICLMLDKGKMSLGLSYSQDEGQTWSDWATVPREWVGKPDKEWVTGSGNGTIYLATADFSAAQAQIDFIKSNDFGKTWSSRKTFSDSGISQMGPYLTTDAKGDLFFSWSSYGGSVRFAKSLDGGETFSEPVNVGKAQSGPGLTFLAVDPAGENVYLISAQAYGFQDVWIARSQDGGKSWSEPSFLSRAGGEPSIVVDDKENVHILWSEHLTDRSNRVLYSVSRDKGATFSQAREISGTGLFNDGNGSYQSLVLTKDGILHPFWVDGRDGKPEVFTSQFSTTTGSELAFQRTFLTLENQ